MDGGIVVVDVPGTVVEVVVVEASVVVVVLSVLHEATQPPSTMSTTRAVRDTRLEATAV